MKYKHSFPLKQGEYSLLEAPLIIVDNSCSCFVFGFTLILAIVSFIIAKSLIIKCSETLGDLR